MTEDGYTLKEVVDNTRKEQTAGFAEIKTLLSTKADKSDVDRLERRLDEHGRDISDLQQNQHDAEVAATARAEDHTQVLTKRQKFWGGVGVALVVFATLAGPVISHFINFR